MSIEAFETFKSLNRKISLTRLNQLNWPSFDISVGTSIGPLHSALSDL